MKVFFLALSPIWHSISLGSQSHLELSVLGPQSPLALIFLGTHYGDILMSKDLQASWRNHSYK